MEYQYSDYLDFEYPHPVLFEYPDVAYTQPLPYISGFPEHRFLTRVTQYFGFNTSLGLRYQRSELDENTTQQIYFARLTRELSDQYSVMAAYQFMELDNGFNRNSNLSGHFFEIGGKFNFAGAVHVEPSYGYFSSSYVSPSAVDGGAHSFMLKLRQALGPTTALQVKHHFFRVDYTTDLDENEKFDSNTLTVWLSQYLPTETAIHASGRFYCNSKDTKSYSPKLEIVHYLNWKTILHLSYRYYKNTPETEEFLQRISGDSFKTHACAVMLEYSLSANTKAFLKYRYYSSDQNVRMNTYLVSLEQIL
jgi:hypothetical protein